MLLTLVVVGGGHSCETEEVEDREGEEIRHEHGQSRWKRKRNSVYSPKRRAAATRQRTILEAFFRQAVVGIREIKLSGGKKERERGKRKQRTERRWIRF